MTELRRWYKDNGICIACGQESAVQGQLRCFRCREKVREANRRNYERHRKERKERTKQYHRERTVYLKSQGLCTKCGKRTPETGKVRCAICHAKDRREYHKRARGKGVLPKFMFGDGEHCSTCGKSVDGTKLCPKCYANTQRTIEIARRHISSGWQFETFIFGRSDINER